jgi:hypothetical protein
MPCLIVILALAFPRVVLAVLFFFTSYLDRAYHGLLVPLIGFIFLPVTTLYYAWLVNSGGTPSGIYLIFLILAVVIDLGSLGGGARARRRD